MNSVTFYLPFGLEYNGQTYRKGSMHLATTADELEIQTQDEVGMNSRYRDFMLLSRVIDELDGLKPITVQMLEELFEADFLYLQLMYKHLNGEAETLTQVTCPKCSKVFSVQLEQVYKDMEVYRQA